jgi:MFS family permease
MERELGGRLWHRAGALASPLQLPDFRRLWAADMISLLGDWAGRLALTVLVLDRTGSPAWAAAVTAVSLAGWVGIGQVLATLADRVGRLPVMLAADLARAALFCAMLLDLPVGALLGLAFLAGVATPPFEAARSAALPDIVPEHRYGDALALSGISIQASLVVGNMLGGVLLVLVGARGALAINALSFLVSGVFILGLRHTAAAAPASTTRTVRGSLRDGAANLFGDRMVRRALVIIAMTGALGTVDEALVVPYAAVVGIPNGFLGVLAAAVPIGTLIGTAVIARSSDHHRLLRSAGLCTVVTAALAVPLYWLEVGGPGAFVAFLISGGMFAVSIPTNVVIGTRLLRDTRASAMGIAVGILMGGQAAGAAIGGAVASVIGPPRAIAGSLALAAVFGIWSTVTTPVEAKHLVGRRRVIPITPPPIAGAGLLDPPSVVDLDALGDSASASAVVHPDGGDRAVARVS